jgi:hypothetical protein
MHDGEYNELNNNDTFNRKFRIYPPGGIIEDLELNPKLIYPNGSWTFSGIMKSENYLNKFVRNDLKKIHGISTSESIKTKSEPDQLKALLLFNDTSDFHFCFNTEKNTRFSLKDILDKRKRKHEKLVLFVSACRVLSNRGVRSFENCKSIHNNKYNIPIPNENPITEVTKSLKQRSIGIGSTQIDTNYYWLRDNKKIIEDKINNLDSNNPLKKKLNDLLNDLLNTRSISVLDYCDLLKQIIEIFN